MTDTDHVYEPEGCARYGRYYWCLKVPEHICPAGEIYVMADRVDVTAHGELVCIGHGSRDDELTVLALAPDQWLAFFAASVLDGSAIAVEIWKGEVIR